MQTDIAGIAVTDPVAPDDANDASRAPIRWPAEAIWEAVAPGLPGFTVEVLPSIDSTNTELMRRLRGQNGVAAQTESVLLVAETQTAGRGRLGRVWQSRRGDSLMLSLSLPMQPADWSGLSLVVGISVAESLDPLPARASTETGQRPHIYLKWPNDLWLATPQGDRKLCGILVETAGAGAASPRQVVIGIGVNIRTPVTSLAIDPHAKAATVPPGGLQDVWPHASAENALLALVPPLVQALQSFETYGFRPFQSRFAARDVLAGREVQLSDGTFGTAHGVAEDGALLVQTAAGMKQITSSEISVRPVAASKPAC